MTPPSLRLGYDVDGMPVDVPDTDAVLVAFPDVVEGGDVWYEVALLDGRVPTLMATDLTDEGRRVIGVRALQLPATAIDIASLLDQLVHWAAQHAYDVQQATLQRLADSWWAAVSGADPEALRRETSERGEFRQLLRRRRLREVMAVVDRALVQYAHPPRRAHASSHELESSSGRRIGAADLEDDDAPGSPLAPAIARGRIVLPRLLSEAAGAFTAAEVAKALGVTEEHVEAMRQADQLLGVRIYGVTVYPVLQFRSDRRPWPGLERVLKAFLIEGGSMRLNVLNQRDDRLGGRTGWQALADGDVEHLVPVVSDFGEMGRA